MLVHGPGARFVLLPLDAGRVRPRAPDHGAELQPSEDVSADSGVDIDHARRILRYVWMDGMRRWGRQTATRGMSKDTGDVPEPYQTVPHTVSAQSSRSSGRLVRCCLRGKLRRDAVREGQARLR